MGRIITDVIRMNGHQYIDIILKILNGLLEVRCLIISFLAQTAGEE